MVSDNWLLALLLVNFLPRHNWKIEFTVTSRRLNRNIAMFLSFFLPLTAIVMNCILPGRYCSNSEFANVSRFSQQTGQNVAFFSFVSQLTLKVSFSHILSPSSSFSWSLSSALRPSGRTIDCVVGPRMFKVCSGPRFIRIMQFDFKWPGYLRKSFPEPVWRRNLGSCKLFGHQAFQPVWVKLEVVSFLVKTITECSFSMLLCWNCVRLGHRSEAELPHCRRSHCPVEALHPPLYLPKLERG